MNSSSGWPLCAAGASGSAGISHRAGAGMCRGRGRIDPSCRSGARVTITHRGGPGAGQRAWLDEACLQGQAGQVSAAPAAALVADALEVGADGAHADVQLGGDLGVGAALGDQGDQFPFPCAELRQA